MTPLHYAAKVHAKGSIKHLLDKKANVNAQNQVFHKFSAYTVQYICFHSQQLFTILMFIMILLQTKNTPLHLAADAFGIWMMPFWFVNSYECILVLMETDDMDLTLRNLVGCVGV